MKNTKKLENLKQALFSQKINTDEIITGGANASCCSCKTYKTVNPDLTSQTDCSPENTFSIRRS